MPGPRTISPKSSLLAVRPHVAFSLRRVESQPLTQWLAPLFKGLLDEWPVVFQAELDLHDAIDDAQIAVLTADEKLNRIADRVSKEVLTLTGEDRSHPMYRHYFGSKQLNQFKRPVLGAQLAAMRTWGPSLNTSGSPALAALTDELTAVVAEADQAVKEKSAAEQARDTFRDLGDRKRYIDKVNAVRKEAYGALATLPHKHTGLPANFADTFFRREVAKEEVDDQPSISSVEDEIKALRVALDAKEAQLEDLKTKAAEETAKAGERAAAHARLNEIEAELTARKKEADALRDALR